MAKRPKLTEITKQKRVEIAQENINFAEEVWKRCIFIDETTFETGPKGQMRVRRLKNTRFNEENILEVQNSGWRSVMCVSCFSHSGIGGQREISILINTLIILRIISSHMRKIVSRIWTFTFFMTTQEFIQVIKLWLI
jgi:hypothetical protein